MSLVKGTATGVIGQRVYGGPTDPISDIPVMIDFPHHQIHEGEAYQATYYNGSMGTVLFKIAVPKLVPTLRTPHMIVEIQSDGAISWEWYEGSTFSSNGTPIVPVNRNRNSSNLPNSLFYSGSSVSVDGLLLDQGFISVGTKSMNTDRSINEWDLASNTNYMLRVIGTSTPKCIVRFHFYEDAGV